MKHQTFSKKTETANKKIFIVPRLFLIFSILDNIFKKLTLKILQFFFCLFVIYNKNSQNKKIQQKVRKVLLDPRTPEYYEILKKNTLPRIEEWTNGQTDERPEENNKLLLIIL